MNPLDQVNNVENVDVARALRQKFLAELAKPSLSDTRALDLENAVDQLEADWPELQESRVDRGRERLAKKKAHPASGGSSRSGQGPSRARSSSRGSSRAGGRRASGGRSSRSGWVGGRARGYFRRTGLPAAATTGADIALRAIGGTLALVLLYLFIGNRNGGKALQSLINTVSAGLAHFMQPVDLLGAPKRTVPIRGGKGGRENLKTHVIHGPPPAGPRGPAGPGFAPRHHVGSHVGGG